MKKQEIKKVLILRLSALGDTIHTLPVAYAIKKTYPDCVIGWVVEDKASLFIKNNPLVDKCYVVPKKEWKKRSLFSVQNIKDLKKIVDDINKEHYDVVFLDPPRSGSDERFLSSLIKLSPNRIVYISCNPETQERDIRYLERFSTYRIICIQPVDMFPRTEHVETIALIEK